jgi:hypothetical protein
MTTLFLWVITIITRSLTNILLLRIKILKLFNKSRNSLKNYCVVSLTIFVFIYRLVVIDLVILCNSFKYAEIKKYTKIKYVYKNIQGVFLNVRTKKKLGHLEILKSLENHFCLI